MFFRSNSVMSLACAALLTSACAGTDAVNTKDSSGAATADVVANDSAASEVDGSVAVDSGPLCKIDADCPALAPCTKGVCKPDGTCAVKQADENDPCTDSDSCTTGDVCKQGKCKGNAVSCDDKNPCTDDYCDASKKDVCIHMPVAKPCGQGDLCTNFACVAGSCVATAVAPCDDGNPCTADTCDVKLGCVFKTIVNAACDDADACTVSDVCKFGKCVGVTKSCGDNNPCTDDKCSADGSCAHVAKEKNSCNDGDLCTSKDACVGGACKGLPLNCNDGDVCTADVCDPKTGLCADSPVPDGTACGAGKVCLAGTCQ